MNPASYLAGIATATFFASSLYFFKFWRASRDSFFYWFAIASALLGAERVLLLWLLPHNGIEQRPPEAQAWVYIARMLAYILLMWAVIQRNRAGRS
jgi:hypothetical protein